MLEPEGISEMIGFKKFILYVSKVSKSMMMILQIEAMEILPILESLSEFMGCFFFFFFQILSHFSQDYGFFTLSSSQDKTFNS